MAKKTKITATTIAKAMELAHNNSSTLLVGKGDSAVEIIVKTRLTLSERAMMISDIVNMVFIGDADEIKYYPEFRKFAFDYNIINYFTNIILPADSDKASIFLETTGIANQIAQMSPDYIADIIDDAREAIDYRKQELIKKNKLDNVIDGVLGIVKSLNKETENIDFPQIMEFISEHMPEFKGQVEHLISEQSAVTSVTA